jgi:hypothetical protein
MAALNASDIAHFSERARDRICDFDEGYYDTMATNYADQGRQLKLLKRVAKQGVGSLIPHDQV